MQPRECLEMCGRTLDCCNDWELGSTGISWVRTQTCWMFCSTQDNLAQIRIVLSRCHFCQEHLRLAYFARLKNWKDENDFITTQTAFLIPTIFWAHTINRRGLCSQWASCLNDRVFLCAKSISIFICFSHIVLFLRWLCKTEPYETAEWKFLLS